MVFDGGLCSSVMESVGEVIEKQVLEQEVHQKDGVGGLTRRGAGE
jgi:hypothetical protein